VKKLLIVLFLLSVITVRPVIAQNDPVKKKKSNAVEFVKKFNGQYDTLNLEKAKKNAVFLRLGTVSPLIANDPVLYSLDYERVLYAKKKFKCMASAGLSVGWSLAVPVNVNFLVGKRVAWESGIGLILSTPMKKYQFYKYYMAFSVNPAGMRYTGKNGLTIFWQLGYYINDLRWIGGDMFYNSPAEYPTFLVSVNFNYGIGYSF
jgi:hypothetical protein